jgi:succinate dehydrogenase/fumarate reductase flavoprotein subunit
MSNKTVLKEERIHTDVLVIGAGAGGMMAAIMAAEAGADVTICEKGNTMRSGGLPGGNDHFYVYMPQIHAPEIKESFIRQSLARGIADEDLLRQFIDNTFEVQQKWEEWGIDMKIDGHYEFTGHGWPGSTGKTGEPGKTTRLPLHFFDTEASVKLEKQMRKKDVHVLNRVMVTELLVDENGHLCGAVGISTRENKIYIFQAKSVVINTGGVDEFRLYPPPNLINYGMAQPNTGDGDIMAYRAGVDIQNAEFGHRQVSMRFGPPAGKGTWIAVVRDSEDHPIAPPFLSKPDAEIGDLSIENVDAIDHVWSTGKGPVWMDPRGISEEDEQYMRKGFTAEAMVPFLKWTEEENLDLKTTRFEFAGLQPRVSIQTRIDLNAASSVPGIFAVFRANLPRSAVGGFIAGRSAGKYSLGIKTPDTASQNSKIAGLKQQYEEILNHDGLSYADWKEVQWAIYQVMHVYALPPNRTESTLMTGHRQLTRVRTKAKQLLKAANPHDLYHCQEVLNLLDIAELVLLAVNERKESRGIARRLDYPFVNPMLEKFLVITQKEGKPSFRWEKPRRGSA